MGVLDDAAEELVKKILPFAGLLDEVKERLDELDGDLEGLQKQLDAEFAELEEKANAFITRVDGEREKVDQKADKAKDALVELKGSVETAQPACHFTSLMRGQTGADTVGGWSPAAERDLTRSESSSQRTTRRSVGRP